MILNGTSIQSQGLKEVQQATVSIAQLLSCCSSTSQVVDGLEVLVVTTANLEKRHFQYMYVGLHCSCKNTEV